MVTGPMSYITLENLNIINMEFTDYCNAACPMCSRYKLNGELYKEKVNQNHTTLDFFRAKIPLPVIRQLKKFYSVGTYGDALMNPHTAHIYRHVRKYNESCLLSMHSNGGGRDKNFWIELARIGVSVHFNIDGLADTNHLYRRNTSWNKIVQNATAFIDAGGKACWRFIVFAHNEHQIAEAKQLSQRLGFHSFATQYSNRWKEYNWVTGEIQDISEWPAGEYTIKKPSTQPKQYQIQNAVKVSSREFDKHSPIECWACSRGNYEIYLRANGNVQPCCMLGDIDIHESRRLIDNLDSVNLYHRTLGEILEGNFFRRLSQGISGDSPEQRLKNCFYACGVKI